MYVSVICGSTRLPYSGQQWKRHLRSMGINISHPGNEEPQTNDIADDIEMLPALPAESCTEESSTVPAETTPIVIGRRYPQHEHRLPLRYSSV